jgi:two-component system CheB/CheR fusion protein
MQSQSANVSNDELCSVASAHNMPRPAQPLRRTGRKILVADDSRDAAESCAMLLSLDGHEVVVACDGATAWEYFQQFKPDVAILDISMPTMSGDEIARCIRRSGEHRTVLLIAMSGWVRDSDKLRSYEAGFDHYLAKPVDYEALSRLL